MITMMKKLFSYSLAVGLLLTAIVQSGSVARAQGPGFVSSLYSRMEKNQRSLKSLRANISMVKYNAQLREEDKYQGLVLYIPGAAGSSTAFVRLNWTRFWSPETASLRALRLSGVSDQLASLLLSPSRRRNRKRMRFNF